VVLVVALAAVIVFAALVGSPVFVLLIAAPVALLAIMGRRHDRPIVSDTDTTRRWYRWLLAGAGGFAIGFFVLALEGDDELSEPTWAISMLSWAVGTILVLFGLVLAVAHLLSRTRGTTGPPTT